MARHGLRHFINLVEANSQDWVAQPSDIFVDSLKATRRIFSDIDEKVARFVDVKLPNPISRDAKYGKHDGPMTGPLAGFYHCHLRDDAILIYRLTGKTVLMICIVSHAETEGKRGKKLRKQLRPFLEEDAEFSWYDEASDAPDIWAELFKGVQTREYILPAETQLFHGTANDWAPDEIRGPAWFGNAEMATSYAHDVFQHEAAVVHAYETTRPYRLLLLEKGSEITNRMMAMMDGGETLPEDMALGVIEDGGFEGWIEEDGEIMLGDMSGLRFVGSL
jgi:mRNA-degrading endonuclease YafQ of YafQ-DinJ toxin-antitoxin module